MAVCDRVTNGDVRLKNIFCAPIYTIKLYKIASHIISARDLVATKAITRQPVKGRALGGGSKLGSKWPLHIVIYVEQLREFGKHPDEGQYRAKLLNYLLNNLVERVTTSQQHLALVNVGRTLKRVEARSNQ